MSSLIFMISFLFRLAGNEPATDNRAETGGLPLVTNSEQTQEMHTTRTDAGSTT
jgi:hypothetical protein